MKTWIRVAALLAAAFLTVALSRTSVRAASHSDAPLIKQDPQANITDVYAFIGRSQANPSQNALNVIVSCYPFSEPGDGPTYDRFSDDVLYSIHITNPTTGATTLRFDFRFSDSNPTSGPGIKNPNTILSYGAGDGGYGFIDPADPRHHNYVQTYTLTQLIGRRRTVLGSGLVPPPNVGKRTTPLYNDSSGRAVSGATSPSALDLYTQAGVATFSSGISAFAGPREDGFYADTPGIFDLLDPRILDNNGNTSDGLGQDGGGVDGFKGYNVLTYGLQIPLTSLPTFEYNAHPLVGGAQTGVIGVYASTSRPRTLAFRPNRDPRASGPFVQVGRMGNPLINELLVPLKDKDRFNRTPPTGDSTFATYALNPELAKLINAVYNPGIPETGRTDLKEILLGPGAGADVIRVNTNTDPVRLAGQSGFSRLSFIGGDKATIGTSTTNIPSGWPNGRRLGDDVVDIALTAVVSGPGYSPIVVVGDNVAANDQIYHQVFPYAATPHAGPRNSKDSGVNDLCP
jgi:hypothetical protein